MKLKKFALTLAALTTLATSPVIAQRNPDRPDRPDRPQQPGRPQPPDRGPQPPDRDRPPGRPMPPPRDEVVSLGRTKLGAIADSDRIRVDSCRNGDEARISAIRIRAIKRAAKLNSVAVNYSNGGQDRIDFRGTLYEGDSTQWIDLRGRGRCITDIRVNGSSPIIIKKAEIEILGLRERRSQLDLQDRRGEL